MATTVTIDNITGIWTRGEGIESSFSAVEQEIEIPGGESQAFLSGSRKPTFAFHGEIAESSLALATTKAKQLTELIANVAGYPFHYFQFAGQESIHDGWYACGGLRFTRTREGYPTYPFDLNMRKIGTPNSLRIATQWNAAAESYSWGGATLARNRLVSLPSNLVTNATGEAGAETRTTLEVPSGTANSKVYEDPTHGTILYLIGDRFTSWTGGCTVWDTVSAGNTNEATWVQVFDKNHSFGGDWIIQNGLLRYKLDSSHDEYFYVYDSVSTGVWLSIGTWWIKSSGGDAGNTYGLELIEISPDIIRWRTIWNEGNHTNFILKSEYTIRRGCLHIRVEATTDGETIGPTTLYLGGNGAGYFTQLFNASASGAAGSGSLATDASNNYHCAYNTTRDVIAGFVLCEKPASQPSDVAADAIGESNLWNPGDTHVFFIIGWSQETSGSPFSLARFTAAKIARDCLYDIDQRLVLVPGGYA